MMNKEIAKCFREIASLLEIQKANYYRVNSFRRAANTVENLAEPINSIVENKGIAGLTILPGIGEGIARMIYEYVATGRMTRLETLRGENDPITMLSRIPGIGANMARNIYENLHIDSLEALEFAAYNGELENVPNIGQNRLEAVRSWLHKVLGQRNYHPFSRVLIDKPTVSMLLGIDKIYCDSVKRDSLPKIAPKRFNPNQEAWLPILHTTQNGWHFTAMYSNSYRAHELDRNKDWVIIYYYDKHHRGGQCTVVSEYRGVLSGRRVVRGRENECKEYYSHEEAV